ncbi:MAG TPA: hypothetical protein VJ553_05185 [Candidatus Paceibacterota bacterium]|nr:hypothetical protein [Candidatus Paceibacterota bacterium]
MKHVSLALFILAALISPVAVHAQDVQPDILFFYSESCPHCRAEQDFLDDLEDRYPNADIERYPIHETASQELLVQLLSEYGETRYLGVVPITIIGDQVIVGFDNAQGIGAIIEAAIMDDTPPADASPPSPPIIGGLDLSRYSLPVVAVILGLLDGFNVCSLGALALILGLVLVLRDRRRILLLGGSFILTTAVLYGVLIVLWYRAFAWFSGFTGALEFLIGAVALTGGIYFLYQYRRFRRCGPTCEFSGGRVVRRATSLVQNMLAGKASLVSAAAAVLLFAAVITIVEFPCSAAVPVVFAGMLADSGMSTLAQLGLIGLFVLFYLLDELIVFGIAVSRMRLWLSSPNVTVWALLVEGLLLAGLGVWYLATFFR